MGHSLLSVAKGRRALAASCAATLLACTSSPKPTPGEVVVVVTTDMAVPTDIDTLRWTVTVVGQTAPIQSDHVALSAETLPGTLAVVSGPDTPGPVLVVLDALHGGLGGTLRVRREAQFMVPAAASKALPMPLDWLCSDANPLAPCAPGQTCVAGACASSVYNSATLADYAPVDAGACFDTLGCFSGNTLDTTVPIRDSTGRCVIPGDRPQSPFDPAHLSIAIVVDTAVTGSYGACAPGGACLVPLAPNSPEGWQPIAGDAGIAGIALPGAICDLDVAVQFATACPTEVAGAALCPVPPTCALSDVDCPSGWRPYACTALGDGGYFNPTDVDPMQTNCWPTRGPGSDGGPATGGALFCCRNGPQPAATDPLLIDDMSGEPQVKLTPPPGSDEVPGKWFDFSVFSVGEPATPLVPPSDFFRYTSIAPPQTVQDGGVVSVAACFTAPYPFSGTEAAMGFIFVINGANEPASFDVSPYTGIRFLAWSPYSGQPVQVGFPDKDTDTESVSTCHKLMVAGDLDAGCGDDFATNLTLTGTPTEYFVQWSELHQSGYPGNYQAAAFDEANVFGTNFAVTNSGPTPYPVPLSVCVADIYFTQ